MKDVRSIVVSLLLFLAHTVILCDEQISAPQQSQELSIDELSPEQMAAFQRYMKEVCEPLMEKVYSVIDRIYSVVSTVSAMIVSNQVVIADKKGAHSKVKQINIMVNQLRNTKVMVANPVTLVQLIHITKALVVHLQDAMRKNMASFQDFNPMEAIKNIKESDLDPKNMDKEIKNLDILVKRLERESENVGLFWYNKGYRTLDKFIIAPCDKYSLHKWVPVGYASAVLLYWLFEGDKKGRDQSNFEKAWWIPTLLKDFIGQVPRTIAGSPEAFNDLKTFGKMETIATLIKHSNFTLTAAILSLSWSKISRTWSNDIHPWLSKNMLYTHNFLKGGAYLKEAARINEAVEEVYFKDIVGLDHVKETFNKIVHYLENPEYYARRGLIPPKGILLVGNTRTGKSYSVKALFNEIRCMYERKGVSDPFKYISINGSIINSAGGFEQLMGYVRYSAPCVIFIDEIDLLDLQRKGQNQMLSEFLTSLSGALNNDDPKKQVIVIAATNNPENLDKALRAAGRLGHELRFELPSTADRIDFVRTQLERLSLDPSSFNINKIAHETDGKSYESLKLIINTAILDASIEGRVVDQHDIERALDRELRNIITIDNRIIPDEQKCIIASHFAGPALYLHTNNGHTKLSQVTIRQVMTTIGEKIMGAHLFEDNGKKVHEEKRFEYGGIFTYTEGDNANILNYEQKLEQCCLYLSGFIAEETLLGASGYSCHHEYMDNALAVACSLAFEGINVDRLPNELRFEYHRKALRIIEECKNKLRTLFNKPENKVLLEAIRSALLTQEALSGEDIKHIIEQTKQQNIGVSAQGA